MSVINRLGVDHLRNLQSVSLDLSPTLNLFYGDNGSGKTSLLEAISILGLGRSFRSHKTRSLVNHSESHLTVFGNIESTNGLNAVGVEKFQNGRSAIRMNSETVLSAALLAKQLPLQIINANSFQLIEGSPTLRRQFLDWMVFHVKPEFSRYWKDLQKLLKQRNSLLRRDKISYGELEPWDIEFSRLANKIDLLRVDVFELFQQSFLMLNTEFSEKDLSVKMSYARGWPNDIEFSQCLLDSFERDKRDGYTHFGPQRADIKIHAKQKLAVDVLSRGQEKALVCAMHIAQAQLYRGETQQACVFLVDDLLAELDVKHSQQLAQWLLELNGQVFVTGVSRDELYAIWNVKHDETPRMFHVKHGEVKQEGIIKQ